MLLAKFVRRPAEQCFPLAHNLLYLILLFTCCLPISTLIRAQDARKTEADKQISEDDKSRVAPLVPQRDFRWPHRRLNVLIDLKSINETERQIIYALFDQIEHKTCLRVNKLPADKLNPFDTRHLNESERNFVYIFKSHHSSSARNSQTYLGLSTLGCLEQGRQSMVLTDLAFRWPELVLRYHVLRSLGVESLERPDGQVRRLLNMLPLSQKISNEEPSAPGEPPSSHFNPAPAYFAFASLLGQNSAVHRSPMSALATNQVSDSSSPGAQVKPVQYLSEEDLTKIKQLYNCTEYQNRLSVKPLNELTDAVASGLAIEEDAHKELNLYSPAQLEDSSSSSAPNSNSNSKNLDLSEKEKKLDKAEASIKEIIKASEESTDHKVNDSLVDEAAKSIVSYLLSENNDDDEASKNDEQRQSEASRPDTHFGSDRPTCQPMESCPIIPASEHTSSGGAMEQEASSLADENGNQLYGGTDAREGGERPMMLKLDPFHARDPQLQLANQMKLSQLANSSLPSNFGLLNTPDWIQPQLDPLQQQQLQPGPGQQQQQQRGSSEMMISFEQAEQHSSNPLAALAGSKVLKLCSCTCQTMTPQPSSGTPEPPPRSSTEAPLTAPPPAPSTFVPIPSEEPPTQPPPPPPPPQPTTTTTPQPPPTMTTTMATPTTTTTESGPPSTTTTAEQPPLPHSSTALPEQPPTTLVPPNSEEPPTTSERPNQLAGEGACSQVQWVKPNKTVYASAKIVWDVDRANRNYFLCNNIVNGELVPGKTHGLFCEISSEGKAYQNHEFNVLIKPEHVNLAWVQRNSDAFGTTNLPVIGGFSKTKDPYVVSRCLVKDENNDIITLIGYVNNQGVGWFPFDDIQIECSQYDVLACIN